jgi:Cu+-exporting ATPase
MDELVTDQKFELAIGGMTCASCVARVEKNLLKVPGVRLASVNLATETAHVEGVTGFSDLVTAVERAGYSALRRPAVTAVKGRREFYELWAAFLLSAPLLAGMVLRLPGWVELALATPVQFWLGARFYGGGWRALRAGSGNMDLLVALGTSAAFGLSVVDFFAGGPLYFESSAVVITLIRLGKFLEGRAKREAVAAVTGLSALRPAVAHQGGKDVAVGVLRVGDVIELRPGERVPMDGVILDGCGMFDESHLTGETLPVLREAGAAVLAGALNVNAVVSMRVTSAQGETFLDRMGRLIDAAQASKPALQKLADRVAAVFVPVVVVIALVTFAGWFWVGHAPVARAVLNAVSVLVIACPCALGLATPAAILAGTGVAARHGILMRNADAIEHAAHLDIVVFDKTGTLTVGRPVLVDVKVLGAVSRDEVMRIAAGLAAGDTHPLSAALRVKDAAPATGVKAFAGRGVEGVVDGVRYVMGSARLIADFGAAVPAMDAAGTVSYLARADGTVLAGLVFADEIRPGAAEAVARLKKMGVGVMMLSGDRAAAAEAVGRAVGIANVMAGASPEEKLKEIGALRALGKTVGMVGDGVNDAAALAAADLGMAIGEGADVALEVADFCLLRPEPGMVMDALVLSRRILWTLREGLFWAVIYNVVGIPLAAFGYLSPMAAGGAMAASSVCVLGNALRLRNWRPA